MLLLKRKNFAFLIFGFVAGFSADFVVSAEKSSQQKMLIPDNQMAKYELPDSSLYEGPVKSGLFHGVGKLTWRNGRVYQGEFFEGKMSGKAELTTSAGDVYIGEFQDGLEHGKGQWISRNGDQYEGEFSDGNFHGKGIYHTKNGSRYESDFVAGKSNGNGTITMSNGDLYTGNIKDWRFHGKGKYERFGKETYEGNFENGYFHGKGTLTYADGSGYSGDFKKGLFDGVGEYKDTRDRVYRGQFVKGQQEGQGKIDYSNGDHYEGGIENWQPHGFGKYIVERGNQYIGRFDKGNYEGEGEITYKNGDRYVGGFSKGRFHGKGIFFYKKPMGRKQAYEGVWEGGKQVSIDGEKLKKAKVKRDKYFLEESLIKQDRLLTSALGLVEKGKINHPELYFLSFGAYGGQDVFMKEALFSENLFQNQFGARGKSVSLINNRKTNDNIPMATVGNLKRALNSIAQKMNTDEDILFLFITSHGSKKYGLSVSLGGIYLYDLNAAELAEMLKGAGIKWKVIVVSACYSGGFIDELKDDYTMVMTSSKSDHVSFGCSDEADFTFFGRAYFEKSVSITKSFKLAFDKATRFVNKWEEKEGYSHSEPQISTTKAIESHLREWRETLNDTHVMVKQ